ncbi:MAG: DUF378 domain-containing protein [Clostridiales bacterium]|jgi:uncharacterized membrane protein YuzA (DUF378 family)|nr:DUF378 domain-containing protein [Clostridiales bacterium]
MRSKGFDYAALTLIIIGAINWGLVGFFRFDLIATLFGEATMLSRIIYALVGLAGLYALTMYSRLDNSNRVDSVDVKYEKNHID